MMYIRIWHVWSFGVLRLSREGREKLVKLAKSHSEKTKISIRKVLQKGNNEARKLKGQVSEDDIRLTEKQVYVHILCILLAVIV